jgi:hypothetical protein
MALNVHLAKCKKPIALAVCFEDGSEERVLVPNLPLTGFTFDYNIDRVSRMTFRSLAVREDDHANLPADPQPTTPPAEG